MGAAVAHRHAEALGGAEADVGARLGRWLQQHQCHQVAGNCADGPLRLERRQCRRVVSHPTLLVGKLQQGTEDRLRRCLAGVADDQFEAEVVGARAQHIDGLGKGVGVDEEAVGRALGDAPRHGHRFRGSGRFVEQGRVGELEAGEVDDHLLEIQQCFEPALSDLRLVGRVRRIPAGIFEHVAQDHGRRHRVVVAHADHAAADFVPAGDGLEGGQRLWFRARIRQRHRFAQADAFRYRFGDQLIDVGHADGLEHGGLFVRVRADMPVDERVAVLEILETCIQHGMGHGVRDVEVGGGRLRLRPWRSRPRRRCCRAMPRQRRRPPDGA